MPLVSSDPYLYYEHIMNKTVFNKLAILADAAKYDASCASSGAPKRTAGKGGLGSTSNGICHAYTPDGRCISLLKILLTNYCLFDCAYCINRRSSNVARARFSVDEVVALTLAFYKRNYIEGLFLSSGVARSPDRTMEEMMLVAKKLRQEHGFAGYIHLKTIPEANPWLIEQAGLFADRLSINLELPDQASLQKLAPEKNGRNITDAMGQMRSRIREAKEERRRFAPAGQSTQLIVGADASTDNSILETSNGLYHHYRLRRVYYSAFSPIPEPSRILPTKAPPLQRENRLYQADWLLRFYGFSVSEIAQGMKENMLDLELDPKVAWALQNRHLFPLDVNKASREMLLRVPGLGVRVVDRLISARRHVTLRAADLARLSPAIKRAWPFLVTPDHRPTQLSDRQDLRSLLTEPAQQLSLF